MSTHATADAETRQLVVFTLGQEEYGVPIGLVQEIIRYEPPRPIPGSPPHVQGVINLRGRIIPVVDLASRFGSGLGEGGDDARIVVLQVGESTVGAVVDDVREVLQISTESTEPPPDGVASGSADYIEGVAKLDGRLLVLLDLNKLFGNDAF